MTVAFLIPDFIFLLPPLHAEYTPPKKIVIEVEDGDCAGKHKRGTQKTKCGSKTVAWRAEFLDEDDGTPPAVSSIHPTELPDSAPYSLLITLLACP
jgi:hypothetical protein